jgi:hypothetical protein
MKTTPVMLRKIAKPMMQQSSGYTKDLLPPKRSTNDSDPFVLFIIENCSQVVSCND